MKKGRPTIQESILRYLESRESPVTFKELYKALNQFSKQGIRNRVYIMIEDGVIERAKQESLTVKYQRTLARFKLKQRS